MAQFGGYPQVIDVPAKVGQTAGVSPGDCVRLDLESDDGYETGDLATLAAGNPEYWLCDYGIVLGRDTSVTYPEGSDVMVRIQGPVDLAVVDGSSGTVDTDAWLVPHFDGSDNVLVATDHTSADITSVDGDPGSLAELVDLMKIIAKSAGTTSSATGEIKVVLIGRRGR